MRRPLIFLLCYLMFVGPAFAIPGSPMSGAAGSGTTNASDLSSGVVAVTYGGTGQNSSASTGTPYVLSGTWSFKTPSQMLTILGLSSTDNVTFNKLTVGSVETSATDNTRGSVTWNTADPTGTNLELGMLWFNITSNMMKVRNGDNSATLEIFTSGATHTLNFATTGTLSGAIPVLDNVTGPTAAQSYGRLNLITGAATVLLPTAVQGMSMCIMDSGTAHDIIVDVQATDNVVLVGSVGAGGVGITNASGSSTGDYVCLIAAQANKWYVMGKQGTWASQ